MGDATVRIDNRTDTIFAECCGKCTLGKWRRFRCGSDSSGKMLFPSSYSISTLPYMKTLCNSLPQDLDVLGRSIEKNNIG